MIALPLGKPPPQDILKFARIIAGCGFFGHGKMAFDHVVHILQHQRRPLLDILCRAQHGHLAALGCTERCRGSQGILDLIAPDAGKLHRLEQIDAVDMVLHARVPVDGLHQPACRRGRHDVIGYTLGFHLGS